MTRTILDTNVSYLPKPNVLTFVQTSELAPIELTKTSFMVPFLKNGNVVLANNCIRGLEIPGGHVEFEETLTKAAHRECFEETGCWVSHIKPIGYIEMVSTGVAPVNWKYPHPLSYQQFFAGDVMHNIDFIENDECFSPEILSDTSLLTNERKFIIDVARKIMNF